MIQNPLPKNAQGLEVVPHRGEPNDPDLHHLGYTNPTQDLSAGPRPGLQLIV